MIIYDLVGLGLKCYAKRKGFVSVIDKLMGTVPKVISWAGKYLTALRKVLWRIGAAALSALLALIVSNFFSSVANFVDILNKKRKKSSNYKQIVDIITCFFSTGGIIALFFDYISDGYVNGTIRVW